MAGYRIKYHTYEFSDRDLHVVSLRDRNEFYDPDDAAKELGINSSLWPMFGVVWPSSLVLAQYLEGRALKGKRILEVGCGIGLASLAMNQRHMDITATDYHPEAEVFLERNARLNQNKLIPFALADWKEKHTTLGQFDLIVGSDLLYEDGHVELLSAFIDYHSQPICEVVIVDPGRSRMGKMKKAMQALAYECHVIVQELDTDAAKLFKGDIMSYQRGHIKEASSKRVVTINSH